MYKALTIAGSDSGGGAGIEADLKTFAALRVYGTCAITSVTAQNTLGVQGTFDLPPEFVGRQLDSILSDIGADAAKTGMLANTGIIEVVAAKVREYGLQKLVIDPVMVAKSGDLLLARDARQALKEKLLPLALVITPNLDEAGVLTGREIATEKEMADAARELYDLGVPYVVIKGGHLAGEATDILFDGREIRTFTTPRLDNRHTHGTGCTFSAALAALLARGLEVAEAVAGAKEYITRAISQARPIGKGYGPVHHLVDYYSWGD
ncbi:bifunctional hydroxymethylpyrimidine kinase/phosphomethylpyrimidine kinase [Neomoorella thermoacetica]|uniref:Hydroxymethylpyrimidine/phosphomethylpyrimidine kinase n=1 Tax=Neomoorella thermoacetica TaxID=1525 RepID=A0A1D7X9I5_NEOTH|nr:bifunctional hydroxymethylpyrimidine kinase/phosphomethylpyrimidine kinase [Moorella thermoacetica]AOQ23534.1 Hydroxymethylpyrimidine/phosphomethylpyrimidine kinase [Moorella thermoacetica]APC07990.1 hydroxymethylpyrimidine/phosphomethylpyrimidine kinase [Moorella thermoacetica]OIQ09727.1 hydroxymethylpyrimidine/phosphomethylpyrimidine kinase [Moorella thermoacetica]OIQ11233.1 hydroxymethylpyrimidine/phosphomethylpyrimidine kinase [Moorella thermoacetica]TYL13718.1 Hydroxymethylpyrimidine/p